MGIAAGWAAVNGTMTKPPTTTTTGWEPICKHADAPTAPATVLDPFCGSGTTGIVAKRLGRDFKGIDLSETYADMARKRIDGLTLPLPLF
jgi:SAM-dependent methyltransferase